LEKPKSEEIRAEVYWWGQLETFQQCKIKVNFTCAVTKDFGGTGYWGKTPDMQGVKKDDVAICGHSGE
jgi:hypothetical protein